MCLLQSSPVFRRLIAGIVMFGIAFNAVANPEGMTVTSGSATAWQNGAQLTVTASQNAFINWQSFNIAPGETTTFQQPSAASIVWNRINDPNPSQIWGHLNANGVVVLMNQSGFFFGPGSVVNAAGFVATTATMLPESGIGGIWQFNGPPPVASIVNYGEVKVNSGGSIFLIAEKIENHGVLMSPDGTLGLYAGKEVWMSERPDGRGVSMRVNLPNGSVDNYGKLVADGGTIALNAQVVNQNGIIQADSVRNQNGVIELIASDQINLGADSQILARGNDSPSGSSGGSVMLKAGQSFQDSIGSQIIVTGGSQGGDGGRIEVSAPKILSLNSSMDARTQTGFTAGKLFLDPYDIVLNTSGGDSAGSGTVSAGDNPGGTLDLNVYGAFSGFSQIILQATHDITLLDDTFWSLSDSTGVNSGQLTLEAGNNIIFGNNASIYDAGNWSVTLKAGVNNFSAGTVQSGVGSIYLNGDDEQNLSGAIFTTTGSIRLTAGQDIQIGSGSVVTGGGGNIDVTAMAGSVNAGTDAAGYTFNFAASRNDVLYQVDASFPGLLGGISTGNGGDVNITAGLDILSYLPNGNNPSGDAGSGAFGAMPGDVTLTAGRNVTGHYIVANGAGIINAGNDAGTSASELALSLVSGGWTVSATRDIVLQEVRNPNGIFNNFGFSSSTTIHYFDYTPDAYVTLNGGNSVRLTGNNVPRNSGGFEQSIPSIYPSALAITAGAGGVVLGGDVILFPSQLGSLNITTLGGGAFQSQEYADYLKALDNYHLHQNDNPPPSLPTAPADQPQLIMSDSSADQYASSSSFSENAHANIPVHLNSPTEVALNISGDMNNIFLAVPEAAQINVVGDMNNSRFVGQNLHPTDVTSINVGQTAKENMENAGLLDPAADSGLRVGGDIKNRNEFTDSGPLASPPDFTPLNQAYPSPYSDLIARLHYDPTTQKLTFRGRMTTEQYNALIGVQVQVFDPNLGLLFDLDGNPVLTTVPVLDPAVALALFNASQSAPVNPNTGYVLGGGGQFNFNADNLDLGATLGIQSVGPKYNPALANYFLHGASINLNLSGNLDMFSTTISSLNGGDIWVNAGGEVNAGSTTYTGNDQYPRGIFTVQKSDVTVIAEGNINVNGSRIAAYDGGNVTIKSLSGDINAGTGGTGSVPVEQVVVVSVIDPQTGTITGFKILTYTPVIPGSGILATTFPAAQNPTFPMSQNTVGNILVETPRGNIKASAGGIIQLPLNGANSGESTVEILAGYELQDANGNSLLAGELENGTPVFISADRDIDASGSGVIAQNAILNASGDITGLIFARNNIDLNAQQNVSVTALAQGTVNVSAGDNVSGTIIGIGGINASGSSVDASLLSQNINASGDVSGTVGFAQGTAANATSQNTQSEDTSKVGDSSEEADDDKKKKGKGITLAQKVSRVTVLLPAKN